MEDIVAFASLPAVFFGILHASRTADDGRDSSEKPDTKCYFAFSRCMKESRRYNPSTKGSVAPFMHPFSGCFFMTKNKHKWHRVGVTTVRIFHASYYSS